jgi:DNA-binding response OmpR family regulator
MTTILIVEDDRNIRESIKDIVELEGYASLDAENGQVGLELARQHKPDLIVCDTMMPVMDGYQMVSELRLDPELATIPVILLTARQSPERTRRAIEMGISDYVMKPFTVTELLDEIQAKLRRRES